MAELTETMALKLTTADKQRIAELASASPLTRSQLAREALRFGLRAVAKDPAVILRRPKHKAREATT